jgi:hypothetical protein
MLTFLQATERFAADLNIDVKIKTSIDENTAMVIGEGNFFDALVLSHSIPSVVRLPIKGDTIPFYIPSWGYFEAIRVPTVRKVVIGRPRAEAPPRVFKLKLIGERNTARCADLASKHATSITA